MTIWTKFLIVILFEIASLPVLIYGAGRIFEKYFEKRTIYLTNMLKASGEALEKVAKKEGGILDVISKATTQSNLGRNEEARAEDSCSDSDRV